MHRRLAEIRDYLAECRADVLSAAAGAFPDPTDPDRWTVADNLDHLRVVETGVSKLLHVKLTRHDGPLPQERSDASVLHCLDYLNFQDRNRRLRAPEMVQPVRQMSRDEALQGLLASRETLLATMERAGGVALGELRHPHPVLGDFDLYQWLIFVGHHERRHAAPIRALRQATSPNW